MSSERKEQIKCPKCGKNNDFTIWNSLNGDLNPEEKQQLIDGTLFNFKCSSCGYESDVFYNMLYHDMTNNTMVYLVDKDSVEKTKKMMDETEIKIGIKMPKYRNRIVTAQNELREKAIIFENGLDDRIIEIIKLMYYINAEEKFKDTKIDDVFFLVSNGKYRLEFIGESCFGVEFTKEIYDDIKNIYIERLNSLGDNEKIIDMDWAADFLKNN